MPTPLSSEQVLVASLHSWHVRSAHCGIRCYKFDLDHDAGKRVQVATPSLGLTFAPDSIARSLKATPGSGALIQAVDSRGAAAKAGLLATRRGLSGILAGVLITNVAGKRIKYPQDVDAALDAVQVGETVTVKFVRGIESVRCWTLTPVLLSALDHATNA